MITLTNIFADQMYMINPHSDNDIQHGKGLITGIISTFVAQDILFEDAIDLTVKTLAEHRDKRKLHYNASFAIGAQYLPDSWVNDFRTACKKYNIDFVE